MSSIDQLCDAVVKDFQDADRVCHVLKNTEPSLVFEIDKKYCLYHSLLGHWEVETLNSGETLGTFNAHMVYYIAKATLKLIESHEAKQTNQ